MKKKIALVLIAVTVCITAVFGSSKARTGKFIITDEAPYTVYTEKDVNGTPRPLKLNTRALPVYVRKANGTSEIAVTMQFNETRTALLNENIYKQVVSAFERKSKLGTLYIQLGGREYIPVLQEKCFHNEQTFKKVDKEYHQKFCSYCDKAFGEMEKHTLKDGVCEVCGYGGKHTIEVEKTGEGTITVIPSNEAAEGTQVTVTAAPAEGYVLTEIIVTDAEGREIPWDTSGMGLTRVGDDYVFTAPPGILP